MAITDDFNRANAGTLGANWTDTVPGMGIVNNRARANGATSYNFSYYSGSAWDGNHTSQVTLSAVIGNMAGPTVRQQAGSDTCYMLFCFPYLNTVQLYKNIAGTKTMLVDYGVGSADGDVMKLEVSGTTLKAYKNTVQIGTDYTDSEISGGFPGIFGRTDSQCDMDDWEGTGEFAGGGGGTAVAVGGHLLDGTLLIGGGLVR